jgi:hypothetical protein
MKRLTVPKAGDTVLPGVEAESIVPVAKLSTRGPLLPVGILDDLVAGSFDIRSLFGGKGQRNLSQKVKTPGRLTRS